MTKLLAKIKRFGLNLGLKTWYFAIILFICLLPLSVFRYSDKNHLFPKFEIIFLYYFLTYSSISYWQIFTIGVIQDQLFSLPIGLSSLSLTIGAVIINQVKKYVDIKDYVTNYIGFTIFCLYIFIAKYLIYFLKMNGRLSDDLQILEIVFQYLATIFTYPLIKNILGLRNAR